MLIGITGDTHNNLKNVSKICEIFNSLHVDLVIHTGDITLPKTLDHFKNLNSKMICVLGNNDQEEREYLIIAASKFNCSIFDEPHYVKIDDIRITVMHHPELINEDIVEKSDLIFHGHTHRFRKETILNTIIFNPGECAGLMEGKNQIGCSDTKDLQPKIIKF